MRLLLIIDDWERLERVEEQLHPYYHVEAVPFGPEGIACARSASFDAAWVDLRFENMRQHVCAQELQGLGLRVWESKEPRLTPGEEARQFRAWLEAK